jgi:hypothetical protein
MSHAVLRQQLPKDDQVNTVPENDPVNIKYPNRLNAREQDMKSVEGKTLIKGGYKWRDIYALKDSLGQNNAGKIDLLNPGFPAILC